MMSKWMVNKCQQIRPRLILLVEVNRETYLVPTFVMWLCLCSKERRRLLIVAHAPTPILCARHLELFSALMIMSDRLYLTYPKSRLLYREAAGPFTD